MFFCSEFADILGKAADILGKAGRKIRRRRRGTQATAKCYAFHAKAIIYCCVLFD